MNAETDLQIKAKLIYLPGDNNNNDRILNNRKQYRALNNNFILLDAGYVYFYSYYQFYPTYRVVK